MPFSGDDYATSGGAKIIKIYPLSKCRIFFFSVCVPRESLAMESIFFFFVATSLQLLLIQLSLPTPHMAFCIPLELSNNSTGIFMSYDINSQSRAVNSQLGSLGCEYARTIRREKKNLQNKSIREISLIYFWGLFPLADANMD